MVVHVFNADAPHLVLSIAEKFIEIIKKKQIFVFYGTKNTKWEKYEKLSRNFPYNEFIYCSSYFDFVRKVKIPRGQLIFLHGVNYYWLLCFSLSRYSNFHFVCWGSGTQIHHNIKSRLSILLKIFVYNRCKCIITLMDEDRKTIQRNFHVNNVHTISYVGRVSEILINGLYEFSFNSKKLVVFLGNNSHQMLSYFQLLDRLEPLAGKLEVHCMLNYSLKNNLLLDKLKEKGRALWGDDFVLDTKLYPIEEYPSYMNQCDVYICKAEEQTGIGAISTLAYLGKKIYLSGKNLSWARDLGYFVSDISELNDITVDFYLPLPEKARKCNREIYKNRFELSKKNWNDYINTWVNN